MIRKSFKSRITLTFCLTLAVMLILGLNAVALAIAPTLGTGNNGSYYYDQKKLLAFTVKNVTGREVPKFAITPCDGQAPVNVVSGNYTISQGATSTTQTITFKADFLKTLTADLFPLYADAFLFHRHGDGGFLHFSNAQYDFFGAANHGGHQQG